MRDRPGELTKRDVLLREWEIVQTAKEGVGDCWPLVPNPQPANSKLDDEQRKALDGCSPRRIWFLSFAVVRARKKLRAA